jgi:hypothetical protein
MTFGDLPLGILLPTVISVAVVLSLVCIGVWVALHPREKPFEETPLRAHSPIDPKDLSAIGGMV